MTSQRVPGYKAEQIEMARRRMLDGGPCLVGDFEGNCEVCYVWPTGVGCPIHTTITTPGVATFSASEHAKRLLGRRGKKHGMA